MKLWRFGKHGKSGTDGYPMQMAEPKRSTGSGGTTAEADYECPWILVCVTFSQVLPRTDLNLCVNEHGEVALIALPDLMVSMAWGAIIYEHPRPGVVLIQQIQQGKDKSYLAPAIFTDKQASTMTAITSAFNRGKLAQGLRKYNWQKILPEVVANNSIYLNNAEYQQRIDRIIILDNTSTTEPDDSQRIPGYDRETPVFLYTMPGAVQEISRQELQREMFVRQLLSESNIDAVRSTLRTSSTWSHLSESDPLVHVINRAEVELKLHMRAWPSFADIMLNPEMSEFIPGTPPKLKFTPKGIETSEKTQSRELGFSILNWGEPNIAQVALHVSQSKEQPLKDTVTSPATTIFKDEMGIHALQAKLFRIPTASFSLAAKADSPVFLDTVPTSQIPEISWKPITEESTSEWWQTDTIAKKVLWLATYNLASHSIGDPEEVICSVTPIGNDVIQVALLFDDLEAGTPYAFAIIKDDLVIRAIPVFQTGTYEFEADGSVITRKGVFLKNYAITRKGERIQSTEEIAQFIKPIYAAVISGKYKEPKIYGTYNWWLGAQH
jgi:hypothetical protein